MRPFFVILAVAALAVTAAAGMTAASPVDEQEWVEVAQAISADPVAQAEPAAQAAPATPGARLRRLLNLTEEQARRVEQILAAHRTRTERLRIDLARARLDAREALLDAAPDRARLDAIARRIGDLQGQLTRARFDLLIEMRSVLTPEQWTRFRMLEGRTRGLRRGMFR